MAEKTKTKKSGGSSDGVSWKKRLARSSAAWKKGVESSKKGGFTQDVIEDGTYIARLTGGKLVEIDGKDGKSVLKLVTDFTIVEGDEKGKTAHDWRLAEGDEEAMKWLAIFLQNLGVDNVGDMEMEDLEDVIKDLVKARNAYRIRLRTGDAGYQNMRVLKQVDSDEDVGEETEDETEEDADESEDEEDEDEKPAKNPSSGKRKKDDEDETDEEEEKEEDEDEESVELEVGMNVTFKLGKKELEGKVKKIDEDSGEAVVIVDGKKHTVAMEDLEILAEADEE